MVWQACLKRGGNMKNVRDYQKDLIADLKNPKEAAEYLNAALEEDDYRVFLIALRNVAEAQGSITELAKACKINRVSLYKMTSKNGNPSIDNVFKLIRCIGLNFALGEYKKKMTKRLGRAHT
jgi:probable addiction module antidote protein